jgi:hypothetical protein
MTMIDRLTISCLRSYPCQRILCPIFSFVRAIFIEIGALFFEVKRTWLSFRYLGINCFRWDRSNLRKMRGMRGPREKIIQCVSRSLRGDREVFIRALEKSEFQCLIFMSEELKDSRQFALEIVENYPFALRFFSERICDCDEIIAVAKRKNYFSKVFASKRLQGELSQFEEDVRACFLEGMEPQGRWMIHDGDIMAPYIQENFHKISEISRSLKINLNFFLTLLSVVSLNRISTLLRVADPFVLRDPEVMRLLISRLPS